MQIAIEIDLAAVQDSTGTGVHSNSNHIDPNGENVQYEIVEYIKYHLRPNGRRRLIIQWCCFLSTPLHQYI